jgi:hypothetical protein
MVNKKITKQSKTAFVLFAKTPELGQVKTRLAASIGDNLALEFHIAFISDSLEKALEISKPFLEVDTYLYLTKSCNFTNFLPKNFEKTSFDLRYQPNGDLGNRLQQTFFELLQLYKSVIVIGTDSPNIPSYYLIEALDKIKKHDLVIGSTVDGGYYLIGLNGKVKNFSELFTNINWSTETVFQETLERAKTNNLNFYSLPVWYDIDNANDLTRLKKDLLKSSNEEKECVYTKKLLEKLCP